MANSGVMTDDRKKILKINFQTLVNNLREVEDVLGILLENEVISNNFMETVLSKSTGAGRNRELILNLHRYGDRAFDGLLLALKQTNQMDLAHQICPNLRGGDEVDKDLDEIENIENENLEKMEIKPLLQADIHRIVTDINNYKINDPNMIGKVIIINNKDFKKLDSRGGSEVDVELISSCFQRLKFNVEVHHDLTAMQIKEVLHKEKFELGINKEPPVDVFILFIMSHGAIDYVYGVDGYEDINMVSVSEIQEVFDGDNCPSLITKPKLFFFQACQRDKVVPRNEVLKGIKWRKVETKSSGFIKNSHRLSDFFVMISTVPGFLSWRHSEKGSFFIRTLVYAIATKCHSQDLLSIATDAQRLLTGMEINTPFGPVIQQPEIRSTLRKKLYFLP